MPYSVHDLSVFDCIRDRSSSEGSDYFEFHAGKRPSDHACWLDGSLFLRDAGFDFIAELFYQTVPDFDYFSFVEVPDQFIEVVVTRLHDFSQSLSGDVSREDVFRYYSSLFTADIWAEVSAPSIAPHLRRTCEDLRAYFSEALRSRQPLVILGM